METNVMAMPHCIYKVMLEFQKSQFIYIYMYINSYIHINTMN